MQASRHVIRDPYAADGVGDAYQLGEGSSVILVCNAAALRCFPKCGLQVSNYTPAQLGAYFHRVFSAADSDGNGVLDVAEVETLLSNTGFKLTPEQVRCRWTGHGRCILAGLGVCGGDMWRGFA